ncbi:NAD-dependent succinate-semialdehyde dehydrogenase [Desulfospira joergensenii]|uniref:NAD-dependent succinate-semialdehyde dehydrogenase n=1 Tax=Desulfospira joergensenii TaxID=53329 RepID=UPI0003B3B875|nr:NAD-dependent succinate-semialdehyde dehydrogenase [Desulfospira joergensenii]
MKSINPATNQCIKEHRGHTREEVSRILEQVHGDWLLWKETSFKERARFMRTAADILLRERDECASIITSEMGKLKKEARAEVEKCALVCNYFADSAETLLQDEIVTTDYSKSLVTFAPMGVILAVMPWNFPFWQAFRFIAPALMAGNGAVLKHASNVFGAALKIEEIIQRAGFPKNLFRSLIIPSDQVERVIENPVIQAVTLTGSEGAGRQVAGTAGKMLKKSVLELGGSDPFLVMEDADLDQSARVSLTARTMNAGQVCISAKRFIVHEKVAKTFEAKQKELFESLVVGDPSEDATQMAPMARPDLVDELHAQVEKSIELGARLVTGGHRLDRPGNYYAPTILADVKKGMPVYDEETFGPVAAIIQVKDEEEAVFTANDTPFGLGASVWTEDAARGERIARRIDSGMVFVNSMTVSNPSLPFGGTKSSGYGRECSQYGIKEFVNIKTICIQ